MDKFFLLPITEIDDRRPGEIDLGISAAWPNGYDSLHYYLLVKIEEELKEEIELFSTILKLANETKHLRSIEFTASAEFYAIDRPGVHIFTNGKFVKKVPKELRHFYCDVAHLYIGTDGDLFIASGDGCFEGESGKFVQLLNEECHDVCSTA